MDRVGIDLSFYTIRSSVFLLDWITSPTLARIPQHCQATLLAKSQAAIFPPARKKTLQLFVCGEL